MATFPALTPTTRIFSPGNYPQTYQQSISGTGAGFRRGALSIGKTLTLTFEYVLEADVNAIKAHYFDSFGTYDIFNVTSTVWSGYVTPPVYLMLVVLWMPIINGSASRHSNDMRTFRRSSKLKYTLL